MARSLKVVVIVLCVVLSIIAAFIIAPYLSGWLDRNKTESAVGYSDETVRAKVVAVVEQGQTEVLDHQQTYQVLEIQILEGDFQQARMMLEVGKNQVLPEDYLLSPDDTIMVTVGENPADQQVKAFFIDFVRGNAIFLLFLLFCMVAIVIGGWTGLRSLFGSLIGLAIIVLFVIPGITQGKNPLLISIIGSAVFLTLSLYIVYGWSRMTHAAVLGMVISLALTSLLSALAVRVSRLSGFGDENMMFLIQQSDKFLDMRGILLAGIIIGSLGVLDDLVIGQSSAVFQLFSSNPALTFSGLFKRAMVIGRDHVAASVNTLILAYAGESLPMLLLFSVTNVDFKLALNVSYIAEEIVRALAGTTGLFLSVPIATFLACLMIPGESRSNT
jgi:uncharacterized membrane protein